MSDEDCPSRSEWEEIQHQLQTDPTAFKRLIEPQLRRQYQQALEALRVKMQKPRREREDVWKKLTKLETSGDPALEHIPSLIELERTTREAGGTAYIDVEIAVFKALAQLSHPDLIPFLLEAFQYRRRQDSFGGRRRAYAVDITATIAARTGAPQALAALDEMLAHPDPKLRGEALIVIYEVYGRNEVDLPSSLLDRFWELGLEDPNRRVRQSALAALQHLGYISYEDAMEYLKGKG